MSLIQWGVVIGASLVAAFGDVRTRRIPNALTFPLLAAGLIWSGWFGGVSGFGEAVGACVLLGMPYVLLFVFAGGGAGDAKLMGAIGAWVGLSQGLIVLLCVAVAGGALALVKAASQKQLKVVLTNVMISFYTLMLCVTGGGKSSLAGDRRETGDEPSDRVEMPYGVAIAVGVCIAATIVAFGGREWLRLW
jgi:prepilin peptidase CpaA